MADISTLLIEQVRQALAEETPLEIVGSGTKAFMGREPVGRPIGLAGHSGIVEYEPTELVITVRAGTTTTAVQEALAAESQCLGCQPPELNGATMGGALACNQSGAARPWAGSIRDHLLGVRLINGKGEHLQFGGRVMKNVAGYDVSRLQAGAMGCLGIVTELSVRVFPQAEFEQTSVLELPLESALARIQQEARQGEPLNGACWIAGKLYLRFSGTESSVSKRCADIGGESLHSAAAFWTSIGDQRHEFFTGDAPLWRISAKAAAPPGSEDGLVDWGGALRWYRGGADLAMREEQASRLGGQASLYRGGDRQAEVCHSRSEAQKRVHLALKQAFDPQGIFNPGRLYSWL